jgi:hypothetical protein
MTKSEFQDRWRYHLVGLLMDATQARTSQDREFFLRSVFAKIDAFLGAVYDGARPAPAKPEPPKQEPPKR